MFNSAVTDRRYSCYSRASIGFEIELQARLPHHLSATICVPARKVESNFVDDFSRIL
jgi:hypothetical protein